MVWLCRYACGVSQYAMKNMFFKSFITMTSNLSALCHDHDVINLWRDWESNSNESTVMKTFAYLHTEKCYYRRTDDRIWRKADRSWTCQAICSEILKWDIDVTGLIHAQGKLIVSNPNESIWHLHFIFVNHPLLF